MTTSDTNKALIYGEPDAVLVDATINDQQVTLHKRAISPLVKLCQALANDNLPIVIVSHWRSFQHQAGIWNNKWRGNKPTLDRSGHPINLTRLSAEEKFEAICTWSAIPGTSRHHWGTDFDIFLAEPIQQGYQVQLTPAEFSDSALCLLLDQWLADHLSRFDFFRPYQTERGGVSVEPWHISYRPESAALLPHLNPDEVIEKLQQHQVAGVDTMSKHMEHYFNQFLFNIDQ